MCPQGFKGDGTICQDVDECSLPLSDPEAATCDQRCINTPGTYICGCDTGYRLVGGSSCIFVNECEVNNGGCDHRCIAFLGGHKCECDETSELDPSDDTKHRCRAKQGHAATASVGVVFLIMLLGSAFLGCVAYAAYKYRLKAYMDHEVRAIMSEYMPLEDAAPVVHDDNDVNQFQRDLRMQTRTITGNSPEPAPIHEYAMNGIPANSPEAASLPEYAMNGVKVHK